MKEFLEVKSLTAESVWVRLMELDVFWLEGFLSDGERDSCNIQHEHTWKVVLSTLISYSLIPKQITSQWQWKSCKMNENLNWYCYFSVPECQNNESCKPSPYIVNDESFLQKHTHSFINESLIEVVFFFFRSSPTKSSVSIRQICFEVSSAK